MVTGNCCRGSPLLDLLEEGGWYPPLFLADTAVPPVCVRRLIRDQHSLIGIFLMRSCNYIILGFSLFQKTDKILNLSWLEFINKNHALECTV